MTIRTCNTINNPSRTILTAASLGGEDGKDHTEVKITVSTPAEGKYASG